MTHLNFEILHNGNYKLIEDIQYYSRRYHKFCFVIAGMISDGATGAEDIVSEAWWVHDKLKKFKKWADGTNCTNFQASVVLHDILLSEGRWFRARSWFIATLIWGFIRR